MADEFNECLETIRYIIKQRGVVDQNSVHAYEKGPLRLERTNTNDIEVKVNGDVVLYAPPPGSSKQVVWEPDDWVQDILEIKERIEHSVLVDEEERISRAKEYCEGYTRGAYEGTEDSAAEADAGGPSYRAGFARGVAAANRARYGESSADESAEEAISDSIRRFVRDIGVQPESFTEEQLAEWKSLQAWIKANGEKSWQELLLKLYAHLTSYQGLCVLATKEEKTALEFVRAGVVNRLAKTSLALPATGMMICASAVPGRGR